MRICFYGLFTFTCYLFVLNRVYTLSNVSLVHTKPEKEKNEVERRKMFLEILPQAPDAVEWDPTSFEDIFVARKSFELIVIKKLVSLFNRGDIPSILEWAKQLISSRLVRSISEVENISAKLESNKVDMSIIPYVWNEIVRSAYNVKITIAELKLDYIRKKDILLCAWAVFDYWVSLTRANFPDDYALWWEFGPKYWMDQYKVKLQFSSSKYFGLGLLGRFYSGLRIAGYSRKASLYVLTMFLFQECETLRQTVFGFVNTISKENGLTKGLPYLEEDGMVIMDKNPDGYSFPYDLESSAGVERFVLHNDIFMKQNEVKLDDVRFYYFPEQMRISWNVKNIADAYKFINLPSGKREIGYFYSVKEGTDYESIKAIWESFALDVRGKPRAELIAIDQCAATSSFQSKLTNFITENERYLPRPFSPKIDLQAVKSKDEKVDIDDLDDDFDDDSQNLLLVSNLRNCLFLLSQFEGKASALVGFPIEGEFKERCLEMVNNMSNSSDGGSDK